MFAIFQINLKLSWHDSPLEYDVQTDKIRTAQQSGNDSTLSYHLYIKPIGKS